MEKHRSGVSYTTNMSIPDRLSCGRHFPAVFLSVTTHLPFVSFPKALLSEAAQSDNHLH